MTLTLAERIDYLEDKFGSLRQAANALGIDPGYLSRLRSGGKVRPSKVTLKKLGLRAVTSYELE